MDNLLKRNLKVEMPVYRELEKFDINTGNIVIYTYGGPFNNKK